MYRTDCVSKCISVHLIILSHLREPKNLFILFLKISNKMGAPKGHKYDAGTSILLRYHQCTQKCLYMRHTFATHCFPLSLLTYRLLSFLASRRTWWDWVPSMCTMKPTPQASLYGQMYQQFNIGRFIFEKKDRTYA
jgi:hypothetical protein